jgi:hypothetical protein
MSYSSPSSALSSLTLQAQAAVWQIASDALRAPGFLKAFNEFLLVAGRSMTRDADPAARSLEVGGSADAVGDHTLALGSNDVKMVDLGQVTVASGNARYDAAARSAAGGDAPQAFADTYSAFDGFDFVYTYTVHGDGDTGAPGGETVAWAGSTIRTVALDIEGWEFNATPSIREGHWQGHPGDWTFTDHVATVNADAQAWGADSYVQTNTDVFVNERYSHAAGSALAWML